MIDKKLRDNTFKELSKKLGNKHATKIEKISPKHTKQV